MQNKLIDDASLWFESRNASIQDYETPEPVPEIPDFIDTETESEPVEYVTSKQVRHELNMIQLNEPTAEIIVSLMDVVLPLVLVIFIKGTDKEDIKLDQNERETLIAAWAKYLQTTSFQMSPGGILITSMLTIYGAKVTMAMMNRNQNSELEELRKENERLKQNGDAA